MTWEVAREVLLTLLMFAVGVGALAAWTDDERPTLALLRGESPFERVRSPPTEAEERAGVVRGVYRVHGRDPQGAPPICTVVHGERRGKSTYERYRGTFTSAGSVELVGRAHRSGGPGPDERPPAGGGGAALTLRAEAVHALEFAPSRLETVPAEDARRLRKLEPKIPRVGRLRWECARSFTSTTSTRAPSSSCGAICGACTPRRRPTGGRTGPRRARVILSGTAERERAVRGLVLREHVPWRAVRSEREVWKAAV